MKRREFIAWVGNAAATWPLAARAQQPGRMRRIGVLMAHPAGDPEFREYADAFRDGLKQFGWVEGRNISFDFRWGALDNAEVRSQSAKELLALEPDLILTQNTPPTASMLQQTRTIPVIFVIVADPVGSGFVKSLSLPGGNATGFTVMEPTIAGKWVELLKQIAPHVNRTALLFNPATAPYADVYIRPFKTAATAFSLEATSMTVHDAGELEAVIVAEARVPNSGLVVIPDGFLNVHRETIVSLAARHQLPTIYPWRFFAEIGGLLSYGSEQRDEFQLAATYANRILRGEKPYDLPVQAPTRYELVINLKTARSLGLNVSERFQQLADKVLE